MHTSATSWPGSTTPGPPTWTTTHDERAIHSASTLDAGGRPMRTTTSGMCASANSRWRSSASNVVTAAGNDAGAARRIGEHGPSGRLGERGDALGGHTAAATGDDHAPLTIDGAADVDVGCLRIVENRTQGHRTQALVARNSAGGSSPGVPVSGSRNGRFRCTGPWRAALRARNASDRHVGAPARSGTPGSWNQRTDREYRWV